MPAAATSCQWRIAGWFGVCSPYGIGGLGNEFQRVASHPPLASSLLNLTAWIEESSRQPGSCSKPGTTRAWWPWRWLCKTVLGVLVGVYVFILFFTPAIGEHGRRVLFEHHALLLPVPF